ncbi:MAG: response regulator [Cyclobacteriaceae bacterium]
MATQSEGNRNFEKELEELRTQLEVEKRRRLELDKELASFRDLTKPGGDPEKKFLANMSHEIRNPINAIVGLINLLYDTKLTPEQFEYVNNIKYSADVLMGLISDILDLSRIESGRIELNEKLIDITEVIKAVVQTFSFKTHDQDIQFIIDLEEGLKGPFRIDPTVVNQIFLNLLRNAVKFTEKGSIKIIGKILESKDHDTLVQFEITDTGIGIPKEQLSMIFDVFRQGSLETKLKYGGTGLGLSIVKKLVSIYKGEIFVESTVGKGSSFTFSLRLNRPDVRETGDANIDEKESSGVERILIVEDNKINQQYLTWLLEKWEIAYDVANHGEEALSLIEDHKYDLILMDIRMPVMDGYETTIRLRNHSMNPNSSVPIIALTASALVDEKEKALEVGINHHLPKPFSPDQLKRILHSLETGEALEEDENTHEKPDIPATFQFSANLNSEFLTSFYGDDIERAGLMFNIFLKNIDHELSRLDQFLSYKDMESFVSLVHKIKPNFAMVGLPEYSESMKDLEYIGKSDDFTRSKAYLSKFLKDFSKKKPDVILELKRINEFLKK